MAGMAYQTAHMSQQDTERHAGLFHSSLLSRQAAATQVIIQGGHQGKAIESLHILLCEHLLKDSRQARSARLAHFPKVSSLLTDKDGTFQVTLGRGLPAESFRTSLIGWLEFLRTSRVIEILPSLEYRSGDIVCNDTIVIQEDKDQDLPLENLRNEALKTSIDAAAQWMSSFTWSQGVADSFLEKKDPAFILQLPYFRMLDALRSDWHAPKDSSHNSFPEYMRAKSDFLTKVYAALLAADKLRFQTKLPGIKKLGDRFPFAWPGGAGALRDLAALHDRLRLIFARDILLSEKIPGVRPDAASPFHHAGVSAETFQSAYQQYAKSTDITPTVPQAHKMGTGFFQNFVPLFSQKDGALRSEPDVLFARNVVVFMIMHCEPVLDYQKDSERAQFFEVVEQYVQKLAAADPPLVDLNTFVRMDKSVVKNENIKKRMIEAVRAHSKVKSLEIQENVTFGHGKMVLLAYHTDQIETVCNRAYLNARDNRDFSLHLNLERIYDCIKDPSRLEPLLRPETYERFLQTREDYYVSQMPFFKRLLWKLFGFARKIDPGAVKELITAAVRSESEKTAVVREQAARTEIRKEQERMARRAVEGGSRESEGDPLERPLSDLDESAQPAAQEPRSERQREPSQVRTPSAQGRTDARPDPPAGRPERATGNAPPLDSAPIAAKAPEAAKRPVFVEAPRPGETAVKPAMARYRLPEESGQSQGGAPASAAPGGASSSKEQDAADHAQSPDRAQAQRADATPSRLSLQELSARAEPPAMDPDHVQFLKQPGPKTSSGPAAQEPDWEQQVIIAGRKMGMDLTEERRLARKKEKELHKKERQALALKKMQEHKKNVARKQAVKTSAPETAGPASPKHLVIIEIPAKYCVSGKPVRIQFQKKYFKSDSFRKEMADFYRKESDAAPSAEDKRYFAFLIGALEKNYSQYLK